MPKLDIQEQSDSGVHYIEDNFHEDIEVEDADNY